jgi:predicted nucleic acid-binding protein
MKALVVDASAILEYLLRTPAGLRLAPVLQDPDAVLNVPSLCDIEVASGVRGLLRGTKLSPSRAAQAMEAWLMLPVFRHGHTTLLSRILALRENFSAYDATYVALAEKLGATLVTADDALMRATRGLGGTEVVTA